MKELSLREIQLSSLYILKAIADICEKHGIEYSLAYGTLLGAVRHKGFIPWDDDIDIMMSRPNYNRFVSFFIEKQNDYMPLKLVNMETEPCCPHFITRITDTRFYLKSVIFVSYFAITETYARNRSAQKASSGPLRRLVRLRSRLDARNDALFVRRAHPQRGSPG